MAKILKVHLHTTTVLVVDGCSLLSFVLILKVMRENMYHPNYNHNHSYLPNYDTRCRQE